MHIIGVVRRVIGKVNSESIAFSDIESPVELCKILESNETTNTSEPEKKNDKQMAIDAILEQEKNKYSSGNNIKLKTKLQKHKSKSEHNHTERRGQFIVFANLDFSELDKIKFKWGHEYRNATDYYYHSKN